MSRRILVSRSRKCWKGWRLSLVNGTSRCCLVSKDRKRSIVMGLQSLPMQIAAITFFEILGAVGRAIHARIVRADQFLLRQVPDRELQVFTRTAQHSFQFA